MENLTWIATLFAALLAIFVLTRLKAEAQPWHSKIVYSILILLLPVVGAVIYLRQREELDEIQNRSASHRRHRHRDRNR